MIIPDSLKQVKPYLTLAAQLEAKNDRVVGYYCRLYALQHGMTINKSAPECKKFLLQQMDMLEKLKSQMKGEEAITSQIVGQAMVEKLALNIFNKADSEDRSSMFSKNLVKQFYSSGLLFDALNYFGDLSEDLIQKKQYAKRKAMYLNRCFQTGEQPMPGPLIGEEVGDESNKQEYSHNPEDYSTNQTNDHQHIESPPNPKPRSSQPEENQNYSNYSQPGPSADSSEISPEDFIKAQKMCKFASSALMFEDIQTAITNLEGCLRILKKEN